MVLCVLLAVYFGLTSRISEAELSAVIALMYLCVIIFRPYRAKRTDMKTYATRMVKSQFFDNYIISTDLMSGIELKSHYSTITLIRRTKNFYLLIYHTSILHIVDKHNFTEGDARDFLGFIKERCPKAKVE